MIEMEDHELQSIAFHRLREVAKRIYELSTSSRSSEVRARLLRICMRLQTETGRLVTLMAKIEAKGVEPPDSEVERPAAFAAAADAAASGRAPQQGRVRASAKNGSRLRVAPR
jgi:hypothetical protein